MQWKKNLNTKIKFITIATNPAINDNKMTIKKKYTLIVYAVINSIV